MRAVQFLAWCAVLSLGACGGKTETGGSGGGGAQAGSGGGGSGGGAGTAGSGAVAGSGAFGGGGSGAVAGTAGTAGAGAMGGMGAVGGGGAGASLWQKAEQVCKVIDTLPCAMPSCQKEMSDAIQYAESSGCADELGMLFDCALKYPMGCDGGEPSLPPMCEKYSDAFQNCIGVNPGCQGWGSSDGSCGMSCGYFDVTCKPDPGGKLQCYCDTGPNAGKMFSLPGTCNSPGFEDAVNNVCG